MTRPRVTCTWRGREVTSPLGRAAVIAIAVTWVTVGFAVLLLLSPLVVLVGVALVALGREGFVRYRRGGLVIGVDREAFRRAR